MCGESLAFGPKGFPAVFGDVIVPIVGGDAAFADALREGIRARGLSLERIRDHLRRRGLVVSMATLSYWQSGRSRPERRRSMAAVAGLEEILGLPTDELSGLLTAPRARGRPARQTMTLLELTWPPNPDPLKAALARLDTQWEDQLARISIHDRVNIAGDRAERSVRTRQVVRAEQAGPDRMLVIVGLDDDASCFPTLKVRAPARLGRVVTDSVAGLMVAELIFGRVLARCETFIAEYLAIHAPGGPASTNWERRFRYPIREYLLEVGFHRSALPAQCTQFTVDEGQERVRSVTPDAAGSVHHVAQSIPVGRCGIRWSWD